MNVGVSGASRCRSLRIAVFTPFSTSTNTSLPQSVHDFTPRDELTSSLHEQNQQIHGLPLESDAMSVAAQLIRGDVKHEVAKAKRPAVSRKAPSVGGPTMSQLQWLPPVGDTDHLQILSSPAPWSGARDQAGLRRFVQSERR